MILASQVRAVDPFASYESDTVNKITRFLTAGKDLIARDDDIYPTKISNTEINISSGVCIKDDVMIHVTLDESLDVTDVDNYIERSLIPSGGADAYIVLVYQYIKQPTPNVARVKLLKTLSNFDPQIYMFLGLARFSDTNVVQYVYDNDSTNGVYRQTANLIDGYTDQDARDAQSTNPITNHRSADPSDYGKVLVSNEITGQIEFVNKTEVGGVSNNDYTKISDYPTGTLTIIHNKGTWPLIQCVDNDPASSTYRKVFTPYDVQHSVDKNSVIITFDPIPNFVTVIY